jgi:preprotein translocase subunit SecF
MAFSNPLANHLMLSYNMPPYTTSLSCHGLFIPATFLNAHLFFCSMSRRSRRKKMKMLQQQAVAAGESVPPEERRETEGHEHQDAKKYPKIIRFYDRYYKELLIIPVLLLLIAIAQISIQTYTTGDFIQKGISLKGGITVTIPTEKALDKDLLMASLTKEFPKIDLTIRDLQSAGTIVGLVVEADLQDSNDIDRALAIIQQDTGIDKSIYGLETIQPSLGASFFREAFIAMIVAFAFMAIVVFLAFRTFVPSFAAVFSVFSDITITIATLNVLDIKVSTAGIAALLMLIGYSVDTDILLSTRVLKRTEGSLFDRILSSIKTGMTMVGTTLAAVIIAIIFTESETLRQIMLIILIGLIADIFNTWIQNAGILRWYVEHRERKHGKV